MEYNEFLYNVEEGTKVQHKRNARIGVVRKISKDGNRALVFFENGTKEWLEYYKIDLA